MQTRLACLSLSAIFSLGLIPSWRFPDTLEAQFRRLEVLSYDLTMKGATPAKDKEFRQIRDFFVSQRDLGGQFLIEKLKQMNADEARFLRGKDDPMSAMAYISYLQDRGKAHGLKYEVCNILSDMFPELSPDVRNSVLRAITASYTPSSYGREDMQLLHHAMGRIGPAAVPYLLELANHQSELVRCGVSEVLESIGEEAFEGPANRAEASKPPKLQCRASAEQRAVAIQEWKKWWQNYGRKLPFPRLPSLFEVNEHAKP